MIPSGALEIEPGDVIVKGPHEAFVCWFDWDRRQLGTGVLIDDSVFTITARRPAGDTALVSDSETVLDGDRKTLVRLSAGTLGAEYEVANRITTNENPSQTFEVSFLVLIEAR